MVDDLFIYHTLVNNLNFLKKFAVNISRTDCFMRAICNVLLLRINYARHPTALDFTLDFSGVVGFLRAH